MVITIDGNWSNGSLRTGVSNLGGVTTNGLRRLGDGMFYCEILSENTVSYKHIGVATPLNQSWISYGKFMNALYPLGSAVAGATYGILLDLTGTVGKFSWNKDGGEFSSWTNLIDSQGNTIKDFRLGIVGSSSGGGTQYFTLNYKAKTFKTKHSDILGLAKGEVYTFDGSEKLRLEKSLFKSKNKTYSLKLTDTWYNLKMTSNDTPSPLAASASSTYQNSTTQYQPYGAFDGVVLSNSAIPMWMSADNQIANSWIKIDYGAKKVVNQISLTPRESNNINQAPRDFYVEYSNDDINWFKIKDFSISNWTALTPTVLQLNLVFARYYKITHLTSNGATRVSWSEIQFGFNGNIEYEVPSASYNNFIKYGQTKLLSLNQPIVSKNYLLQDKVSENSEGFWATQLNRKPLSIGFN